MPTVRAIAAEHADVFAHFEAEQVPECSVYSFSPAFPCQIGQRPAVVKRTPGHWVAYPFIDGRVYDGRIPDGSSVRPAMRGHGPSPLERS